MTDQKKPGRKVSETLQDVRFDRESGLLLADTITAQACPCCGFILVVGFDVQGKAFVEIAIDTEVAFEFAGVLLRARDDAAAIKAGLVVSNPTNKGIH
jgi:hypothetical protein